MRPQWPDLSDVKGQLSVLDFNLLRIFIVLLDLKAVLEPGYLSLRFDVSYLYGAMAGSVRMGVSIRLEY